MNKTESILYALAMSVNFMPLEHTKDVFHYTSANGFTSIMFSEEQSVKLWASRFECLNDASEGTIARGVFEEVCEEFFKSKVIDEKIYEFFLSIKEAENETFIYHVGDSLRTTYECCERYVCSFSENADSLAMWNYYSKESKYEGFNIGFFTEGIKTSLDSFFHDKKGKYYIYAVIYDRDRQKQLVEEFLLRLIEAYSTEYEETIRHMVSNRLLEWSLLFKNDCFRHEEEVRIVVELPLDQDSVPLKYRISLGRVVPYIELPFEKYDVSFVTFGPLQRSEEQKEQQKEMMEKWLLKNNFNPSVEMSKIPVRY